MTRYAFRYRALALCSLSLAGLIGCTPTNNTLVVSTYGGKYVTGSVNPVTVPIIGSYVGGQFANWINNGTAQLGTVSAFTGTTLNPDPVSGVAGAFTIGNVEMPANWDFTWFNDPAFCVNQASITQYYPVPYVTQQALYPSGGVTPVFVPLLCYANDPTHPNFTASNVSPQFALDDHIPSSMWVASLDQIPSGGTVSLNVYNMALTNVATMTATSISGNGTGATFGYPVSTSGGNSASNLPAGAYIATLTNQIGTSPVTTHGFEPFYIAHDDTSFPGAYGLAVASPLEVDVVKSSNPDANGACDRFTTTTTSYGGTAFPLVTLLTQGELAIGSSSNTVSVGLNPTAVVPYNTKRQVVITNVYGDVNLCQTTTTTYTGAQSALVTNTGSNSVSLVQIGTYPYPSGTVAVGSQPVAAVINSPQTFAYVVNYGDGTISEVDLTNLVVTRTLYVMTHPTSVAFDQSGNLWVGGQGFVSNVSISNWNVASTIAVDGTVNGMSYDASSSVMLQTILQNGSSANPSNGLTAAAAISYSSAQNVSYSTQNSLNLSTGVSTTSQSFGDNSAYVSSPISSRLAYASQTAFSPPVYSSSAGDITATVSGTYFVVSVVGTGQILIQGNLPSPARGIGLSSKMLYFTMPDTNSLVSLPIQIP